jgi:hypothetical protein
MTDAGGTGHTPELFEWGACLGPLAAGLKLAYGSATPFPHIVIDDFLPRLIYEDLVDEFPGLDDTNWHRFVSTPERGKSQIREFLCIPPGIRQFILFCNSAPFLRFLEELSGISRLIPDPYLHGGGLHQTEPGGRLGVHVDYTNHPEWGVHRRLNVILFLNESWEPAWGGALELWEPGMASCVRRVEPVGNRLVVFTTTDSSWHGHPDPLQSPPGINRRSLALYYYTADANPEASGDTHGTRFHPRPGERFQSGWRDVARDWLPPAVLRALVRSLGRTRANRR